jgi:hypothetical protein
MAMNIEKIPPSTKGGLVWLTAGKVRCIVMQQVFTKMGWKKLLPCREKRAIALRSALLDTLREHYGKRKKLRVFPLDRRVLGFDVREHIPGAEKSELPYLLTAKADERHAWITLDGLPGDPQMSRDLSDRYLERVNYYCPTTTGALIKKAIESEMYASSVKGNGGLWFLPGAYIDRYRQLASELERSATNPDSECIFSLGQFQLCDNPEVARDAMASVIEDAKALSAEINADLLGTGATSTDDTNSLGMTKQGVQSRKDRLASMMEKVKGYAAMFGVGLTEIEQLLAATDSALALAELNDLSA